MLYKFQRITKWIIFIFVCINIFVISPSEAINLTIQNKASTELKCKLNMIDDNDISIQVLANQTRSDNFNIQIKQADCNGLIFKGLKEIEDHNIIYEPTARRTLNVLLYPYIPSPINDSHQKIFGPLKESLISGFQSQHPEIALNLVLSENAALDPYTPENFEYIFGEEGYDIVETDMIMLQDLIQNKEGKSYINIIDKSNLQSDQFIHQAIEGATSMSDGQLYGIPSWVCMNFIFSKDTNIMNVETLDELEQYIKKDGKRRLLGIFNGSFALPSDYLNTYSATNNKSLKHYVINTPIDQPSINNLVDLTNLCVLSRGKVKVENKCTNRFYKDQDAKLIEDFYRNDQNSVVGYSEFSFKLLNEDKEAHLSTIPLIPGNYKRPSMYVDAYTQNKSSCSNNQCKRDYIDFTNYMNDPETRIFITLTEDLPNQVPRHLLPAIQSFYNQPKIQKDSLYPQFYKGIGESQDAMINNMNSENRQELYANVCRNLKKIEDQYGCLLPQSKRPI